MRRILVNILSCILIAVFSCNTKEQRLWNDTPRNYEVALDDDVKKLILDYIDENKIDVKSKVISTQWVTLPYERTDIYVSNEDTDGYKNHKYSPSYYSVIEGNIVVFIYSNIEMLIERKSTAIISEVEDVLDGNKVNLKPDSGYFYHPKMWLYSTCGETKHTYKNIPALEYQYIPCEYILVQDTVTKNSLRLLRRE